MREVTIKRLAGWAESQFDGWRDGQVGDPESLRERLERLETTSPTIFLFDFAAGAVSLRRKTRTWPEAEASEPELLRRARHFLILFREVVAGFGRQYGFLLAIDVDDHPLHSAEAPLFAFQRQAGSRLILLPDIDILSSDYFVSPEYDDPYVFEDKVDGAIFVGATTGANLTREVVEALAMPRLRSAVFFRDVPDVTFRLPKIVQYDTEETAESVRALGVGGPEATWKEQFGYKYLLSMDGNGATCSRVAIALRSRSVLVKYASEFELFYFDGLEPGANCLSVSNDEDVLEVLEWCRRRPRQTPAIARAARQFAHEHLARLPVFIYVASLLDAYQLRVTGRTGQDASDIGGPGTVLDVYGHIGNIGDSRAPLQGWLGSLDGERAIEGFAVEPGPGVDPLDIVYEAVLSDGSLSGQCFGYDFCGSRGRGQPLRGLSIRLRGAAAKAYELSYLGAFADGLLVGPTPAGTICCSPQGAELIGLRLKVRIREGDLQGS